MNLYSSHTDSELLYALHEGEVGAFTEIYYRYYKQLYRYAHQRVRDAEECKEMVQEVFESLWKTETNVRELGPFLFTMIKFKVVNFYEHKIVENKFSNYIACLESDPVLIAVEENELDELRGRINRSMKDLPDRCQDAVKLRIDENLSLDEIALRMNVNKHSVKRYLTMAMNYFRKVHAPIYKIK